MDGIANHILRSSVVAVPVCRVDRSGLAGDGIFSFFDVSAFFLEFASGVRNHWDYVVHYGMYCAAFFSTAQHGGICHVVIRQGHKPGS